MGQPMAQHPAVYASSIGNGPSLPADEHDWEYEYDENETDDFFFTLDLTTHVPNALVQAEASLQGHHQTTLNPSARPSAPVDAPHGENADSSDGEDEPSAGQLQIVDLHTARPLVKLDDNVYTCAWSTDLGTQFHVAKAGDVNTKVRRAGTVLDIIGTSQTRLLGIPVTLQPRNDVPGSRTPAASGNNALGNNARTDSDIDADEASEPSTPAPGSVTEPGVPLQIDRTRVKHRAGAQQASFLERLSRIKLKKGETDQVPIYSVKQYHHVDPARQAELKQAGRALDAHRKAKAKEDEVVATGQRPRKRRRKLTHAEKGVERGNQAGAGRQARDAVAQRLGFSDDAPPSNRNARWARQPALATSMAYSMGDAPRSASAGQEAGEVRIMSATQAPKTNTPAMPDTADSMPIASRPQKSTTAPAMSAVADPGPTALPPQDSNAEVSAPEPVDASSDPA